ncbi:tetratricopeptide repeat protein [Frigoriglobus tundricola]|uniref:Uncharacterized protein n=1 Tax=Frigoriglobus tundricola TaxID=2774151 RepID=A0A6M5Z0R7_9BACT|nr:tetratricopeptide repeat protein [Frigoriglobus tundricola]QJW99230.1 hypothetical protein FTUN_6832 [Frigoriglobus tundricola]
MSPRANRLDGLVCLGLVALTASVFAGVLGCEFVTYDDPMYVLTNPAVTGGLTADNVSWAWTGKFGLWHPLTWMSLQLDTELFGLNPARFHLTNLLLHCGNVLLVYGVLTSLTGARGPSAAVAALFAVHPLNVETVAWVSERKGLLSMFFGLIAVGAYGAYVRAPGLARYGVMVGAYTLSLLAKPVFVSLPLLLLLLDYWPLRRAGTAATGGRSWRQLAGEKLPLVGLAVAIGVVTIVAEDSVGALPTSGSRSIESRLKNGAVSYAEYLRRAVYPNDLAPFYPHPGRSLPSETAVGSALLLVALSVLAVRTRERLPYLLVGWSWFVVALLPMSGLIQVGGHAMADRYAYLPLIGLLVAVCWGVRALTERSRWVPAGVAVLAVGASGFVARAQVEHWKTSEALWEHTLAVTARNHRAHFHLGKIRAEEGRTDDAIRHFRAGLEFHPRDEVANFLLGCLLADRGQLDEAAARLTTATETAPQFADAWWQLGRVQRRRNDPASAAAALTAALKLRPNDPQMLTERGTACARAGRPADAVADFRAARAAGYESVDLDNNMGIALAELGLLDEARARFRSAVCAAPDAPDGYINLGFLMEQLGQPDEAADLFRTAARVDATAVAPRSALGLLLRRRGRPQDAVPVLEAATGLKPDDPELWFELGLTWEVLGTQDRAAGAYRRAAQLRPGAARFHAALGSVLVAQGLPGAADEFRAAQADADGLRQCARTAFRLAAHQNPAAREEKVAVCLARAVCRASGEREPALLDLLAIAYASDGQFARALEVEQKAIELSPSDRPPDRAVRERMLKSFRDGKPVRDTELK